MGSLHSWALGLAKSLPRSLDQKRYRVPSGASSLAQPFPYGHSVDAEMLCELNFGHTFCMGFNGDFSGEFHCFRESVACFGQIACRFCQSVHV